jgi:hypothetical protein
MANKDVSKLIIPIFSNRHRVQHLNQYLYEFKHMYDRRVNTKFEQEVSLVK